MRSFLLLLSVFGLSAAGATEPSQQPLVSRVGEVPKPNVMVTLDDSDSMLADFMPEGAFTLHGRSVTLASGWTAAFPNDPRKTATYPDATVASEKNALSTNDRIYQMQYRSPDVNTIWYNPDIRYLPWIHPDGGRYPNANPAAARWDPVFNPAATFNLTAVQPFNIRWATAAAAFTTTAKSFHPALVYRLVGAAGVLNPTLTAHYVRYDLNVDGQHAPLVKAAARTDCAGVRCTQAEELQNFANWFTYYRMRESMAKAAVSESLANYVGKMRVGWGRINKSTATSIDGSSFTVIQQGVRDLDTAHLRTVLSGIQGIASWPSTPLRSALNVVGSYFDNRHSAGAAQAGNPWLGEIGNPDSGRLSCRRSVNLLTTDGYYNDTLTTVGDWDSTDRGFDYAGAAQNPDGHSPTGYVPARPFRDGPAVRSNTLADVAMKYFVRDLDTQVPNRVAPVDGDIAYWQHLTQFTVGIGVKGTLDSSTPAAKKATLDALAAGTLDWTDPATNPGKIDDLWHAAVNTGGDFYSVTNVSELTRALYDAFGKAVGNVAREAGVATVATTLTASNVKFVPEYRSVAWQGDVKAYALDAYGVVPNGSLPLWSASAMLPPAAARNLYTLDGVHPVAFGWATIGAANQALLSAPLLAYVRGDTTQEGSDPGEFRERHGKLLGDFINSPPVLVKDLVDLSYELLADGAQAGSYRAHVQAKSARTDGLLFVGGNAGILHAFRASDGVETFGFLPRTGLANLPQIAASDYGSAGNFHRYFVDGPLLETDAYIVPRGAAAAGWTNLLLGAMGAGGKSVFALTVPVGLATPMTAQNVQWELSGDSDLGHVLQTFRAGKVQAGGGWYAFVGNGLHSPSGRAVLLVVDLQTGAVAARLAVPTSGANGLMGVRLLRNAHQEVYAAYAGDLQGNLWRFDFEGASPASWKVGFQGHPLFRARGPGEVVQPVSAAPAVILHPSGGHLVLFGTGRLSDLSDAGGADLQSFYGVWDKTPVDASSADLDSAFAEHEGGASSYRSKLVEQTLSVGSYQGVNGVPYSLVSSHPVNWSQKKGWFLDLTLAPGQRVTAGAQTLLGWVFFTSITPAGAAAECEVTQSGAYSFMLDALTGAASADPQFDLTDDGVVNASDVVDADHDGQADGQVGAFKTTADGVDRLLGESSRLVDDEDGPLKTYGDQRTQAQSCEGRGKCDPGYCLVVVVNTSNQATEMCAKPRCLDLDGDGVADDPCCANPQLCAAPRTIRDRVWKRLVTPPSAS